MPLRLLRKGLFYSLAGVYCAVCPALVLYSLGYIYAPGSERGIVKSGLIHVETLPPGADVHLEDKRFTQKTPATLQGLLPGQYHVTVTLKDYRPWRRVVQVRAEEAEVFNKVVLLPKEWRVNVLSDEEYVDLLPSRASRHFVLSKGPLVEDLFVYDIRDKKASPATAADPSIAAARVLSSWPAEDAEELILHLRGPGALWGDERLIMLEPAEGRIREATPEQLEELVDADGPLHTQTLLAEQGILGAVRDDASQRLLVWSENKLGVLDLSGDDLQWRVSKARKIQQAFWVLQGTHILYRDGSTLYLLNTQDALATPEDILQVKRGSSVVYRERSGKLYFLQKGTGRFCEIEMVQKNAI
jgi:hypothetical protein